MNNFIRQAKRTWYNKQILHSNNITKTKWTVIKTEIGKKDTNEDFYWFNPLNAELNPICHLLALLGAHHILHVSGIRVNNDGNNSHDYQSISDSFSTYYLLITEKIT